MPKRVSVQITADSSGFDSTISGMAGKTRKSADEIKAAAGKALGSVSALTAANSRLVKAQAGVADASGAVRLAEERLAQVRKRSRSTAVQNAAAEEALAKAQRGSIVAQRDLASAQDKGSLSKRLGTVEVQNAGRAVSIAGLAIGAGVAVAVRASANFEQAMSGVASTGAYTKGQLELLSKAAVAAGQATQFSATDAAQGEAELVKAGLSVQQVLGGGLTGALNLAAAGNLSVAESASAAATAINQFGLQGSDATHVADRFVQIAGIAQGETSDVAEAFKNGAVTAKQYGLSIDDASTVLGAFAQNGIVGAQAGTLLKSSLTQLYAPTGNVKKALDQLGVSAYDAAGNAKPVADVAEDLKQKLSGLDEQAKNNALARIFGKETLQGGAILAAEGAAGLGKIRAQLDAFPTAASTAATKMDNLKGDVENLSGSFETLLIKSGSGANGFLRDLAQGATGAVNAFSSLPDVVQKGSLGIAAVASAGLLAAGGFVKIVSGVASARTALDTLGASGGRSAVALGKVGKAAGVAAGAFIALQAAGRGSEAIFGGAKTSLGDAGQAISEIGSSAAGAAPSMEKFFTFTSKQDLDFTSGGVNGLADAFRNINVNGGSVHKVLDGISGALGFTTQASQINDRFTQLDTVLTQMGATSAPQAAAGFAQIAAAAAKQQVPVEKLVELFPAYKQQLQDQATALGVTVPDSAKVYADWMGGKVPDAILAAAQANPKAAASFGVVAAAADQSAKGFATAQGALKNLINPQKISGEAAQALSTKLFGNAQAAIAASDAQIAYGQAVRQAKASTGGGIDPKNEKGASNLSLLNQQASAYQQVASAQIAAGKSAGTVSAGTQKARNSFIANAEAMGVSSGKAKDLADKYGLIPKNVKVKIEEQVQKSAEDELTKLKSLDGSIITPKIQALIDQGKYKEALSKLKDVQKDRRAKVKAEAETKGAEGKLKSAAKTRQAALKAQAQNVEGESGKLNRAAKKRQAELAAKATGVSPAAAAFTRAAKKRQAEIKAQATGIGAVQSQINSIKGKTVNISVVTTKSTRVADNDKGATGGMFTEAGFIMRRSMGGPVWGAGTATSDSIPALLSNGEFVINAKSVKAIGADRLAYANREGVLPKFAAGGSVKGFAAGGLAAATGRFQLADIMALLRSLANPIQEINTAAAAVKNEQAKIGKPAAAKARADRAYEKAKDKQEDLRDRVDRLRKAAAATKGSTKADRDLAKARRELASANTAVSKTSREKTKATAAYNAVAGPLKEATDRLVEAQKALADSARTVSDSFADQYRSTSTDAKDWIDLMKTGAADLIKFNKEIAQLRKTGLSETLVQQILNMGAAAGGEIAEQILAGGAGVASALNAANDQLQNASDNLGFSAVASPKRYASGGLLSGPGTGTSDSLNIRASTGEYVVNAASTATHRGVLDAINYGRASVTPHRFTSGYATGGFVQRPAAVDMGVVRAALAGAKFYIQSPITGEHFRAFVQTEAGGVLDRETAKIGTSF